MRLLVLFQLFITFTIIHTYLPPVCSAPDSNCIYGNQCEVCCVPAIDCGTNTMDLVKLRLCISGSTDGSTYDYSNVKTIYLSGCANYDLALTSLVLDRSGTESQPIFLRPYPDENVKFVNAVYCLFSDTGADYWEFGAQSGSIACESSRGVVFSMVNFVGDKTTGFRHLKFENFAFVATPSINDHSISFFGDSTSGTQIGSIQFEACSFQCSGSCSSTGIHAENLNNDPSIPSSISVTKTTFTDIQSAVSFISLVDIYISITDSYFVMSSNGQEDYVQHLSSQDGIFVFTNNVVEITDSVTGQILSAVNIQSDTNFPRTHITSNLFVCETNSEPENIIGISSGSTSSLVIANNVFRGCDNSAEYIFWDDNSGSDGCNGVNEYDCLISSNLLSGDVFTMTLPSDKSVNIDGTMTGKTITFHGESSPTTLPKPSPYYQINEIFQSSYSDVIPSRDMDGKLRINTNCVYHVGPIACECKFGWEWDSCDCDSDSLCSNYTKNNIFNTYFIQSYARSSLNYKFDDGVGRRDEMMSESTIKSVCTNEFWVILIDSNEQLWIYGEDIYNNYLIGYGDTSIPIKINTDSWNGRPKKVACSQFGIYVLTHKNSLYHMGSDANCLDGTSTHQEFIHSIDNVYDIITSYDSLYVQMQTAILENSKFDIKVVGGNQYGSLGIGNDDSNPSDNYMFITTVNFPATRVYPRIQAFAHGVLFSFSSTTTSETEHYYCGKDHPSLGTDIHIPTIIDFDSTPSQLENTSPIDFISRIRGGGCMYIISENKIYISGTNCNGKNGLDSNGVFPHLIQLPQRGMYLGEKVFSFTCGFTCYLVTVPVSKFSPRVFIWGKTSNNLAFGGVTCANNNCDTIQLASLEKIHVVPGLGDYKVNHSTMVEHYDVFSFDKQYVFDPIVDNVIDDYTELLLDPTMTGLIYDKLTISLRKKERFFRIQHQIFFDNSNGNPVNDACRYPKIGSTRWKMWNERDYADNKNYDYFQLHMNWFDHRSLCQWSHFQVADWDIYFNTLVVKDNYFLGFNNGKFTTRTETQEMKLQIKFPRLIYNTNFVVKNNPFSDYYDVYIYDQSFDRNTRMGKIMLRSVCKYPNYFTFDNPKIGVIVPEQPVYFVFDEINIYEVGVRDCSDERNCHQHFEFVFQIIDDSRICSVPLSTIPVKWISKCVDDESIYCDSDEIVDFDINLGINNLCSGVLVEDILTTFEFKAYTDWSYITEIDTSSSWFEINDILYFKVQLGCNKVSIIGNSIDSLVFKDSENSIRYELMINEVATEMGVIANLVIDPVHTLNVSTFHFTLTNEITNLKPGERKSFIVEVMVKVFYEGNPDDEAKRRMLLEGPAELDFGTFYSTQYLNLQITGNERANVYFVPYVVAVCLIIFFAFAIGACILAAVSLFIKIVKQKRDDDRRFFEGLRKGEGSIGVERYQDKKQFLKMEPSPKKKKEVEKDELVFEEFEFEEKKQKKVVKKVRFADQ